jgi:hypothetical protein
MISLEELEKECRKPIGFGKDFAFQRYQKVTGRSQEEAEVLYEELLSLCNDAFVTINLEDDALIDFITDNKVPSANTPYGPKCVASISLAAQGNRANGVCSIVLRDVDKAFCFCGSFKRLKDPSREDFTEDESNLVYPMSARAHCKVASMMLSIPPSMLLMGKDQLLEQIKSGMYEFGKAVVIFDEMTKSNMESIIVPNEEKNSEIRRAVGHLRKYFIIDTDESDVKHIESKFIEENNPELKPGPKYLSLAVNDNVMSKPMASHLPFAGVVVDISNGLVTIEWENKTRSIIGMVEAMSRLMIKPEEPSSPSVFGEYVLDGMDEKTVRILSAVGIDPVNVYSLVSFCRPSSPVAKGWQDRLIHKISQIGIKLKKQDGYKECKEGIKAFEKSSWLEGNLPDNARFIVDIGCSHFRIAAGDVEEYIVG